MTERGRDRSTQAKLITESVRLEPAFSRKVSCTQNMRF
jgi:hypothetical protein